MQLPAGKNLFLIKKIIVGRVYIIFITRLRFPHPCIPVAYFEILEAMDILSEDKYFCDQCLFKYETKYYRMSNICGKQPVKIYLVHMEYFVKYLSSKGIEIKLFQTNVLVF